MALDPQGPSGPQELELWLGLCTDDSWTDTAIISLAGAATSIIFVATSLLLSGQTRVCRDQTGLLSRQKYFIDKSFVAASILLSRQKTCFVTVVTRRVVSCGTLQQQEAAEAAVAEEEEEEISNLVFYAQSTITTISGRRRKREEEEEEEEEEET